MAYSRGTSSNIIVGAAALFAFESGPLGLVDATGAITTAESMVDLPNFTAGTSYKETLTSSALFRNVGYTSNGMEIQFMPDFAEIQVDQILDAARLYKQGMKVNLNTTFAEATLQNLLFAIAGKAEDLATGPTYEDVLTIASGSLGECPVERGLVAIGPGTGNCAAGSSIERIYIAYRALSIESVTVSAKRDAASEFAVSFRLLPNDDGNYGRIVDRTVALAGSN